MCVIAVSRKGSRQPSEAELREMFTNNSHGAGYMYARKGKVIISKGYMNVDDFIHAIKYEKFTNKDAVVYHCRISTQAGRGAEMTHPFPLTNHIEDCKMLDCVCPCGVAHNGIISLTSDPRDKEYSDTAHYIAEFLTYLIRTPRDLRDPKVISAIERMTMSKWAIMDADGYIATAGSFINEDGVLFSNSTYKHIEPCKWTRPTTWKRPTAFTLEKVKDEKEPKWSAADFEQLDC